jgi:hypothetical protein
VVEKGLPTQIERDFIEERQRERVRLQGVAPLRKLLLVGPAAPARR